MKEQNFSITISNVGCFSRSSTVFWDERRFASSSPKVTDCIPPTKSDKVGFFIKLSKLEFYKIDEEKYPCFGLALNALKLGGTCPCALNAASEIAVRAFLEKEISFTHIAEIIEKTVSSVQTENVTLESLKSVDEKAREIAYKLKTDYIK